MPARICTAKKSNGDKCKAPAMKGQLVCRVHGGSSPQAKEKAKERLLEAVDPMIAELVRLAKEAKRESDRIRAIQLALDYAGLKGLSAAGFSEDEIREAVDVAWPDRRW